MKGEANEDEETEGSKLLYGWEGKGKEEEKRTKKKICVMLSGGSRG